jgi:hypothetical protein
MKKTILLLFLLGGIGFGFAQNQFEKMPENAKEIHFTYKRTSKILVDEEGVCADSVLFKTYFPDLNFSKISKPKTNYLNAIIPTQTFKDVNKAKLISMLYHQNELYTGTFFVKENKAVIDAKRNDDDVKMIFKKYFKESYSSFSYKIKLDYEKKVQRVSYPKVTYRMTFDEVKKEVKWLTPTAGTFVEVARNIQKTNTALFDENISEKIAFDYIFTNSTKGLLKVESIENKLELVEVHYK